MSFITVFISSHASTEEANNENIESDKIKIFSLTVVRQISLISLRLEKVFITLLLGCS